MSLTLADVLNLASCPTLLTPSGSTFVAVQTGTGNLQKATLNTVVGRFTVIPLTAAGSINFTAANIGCLTVITPTAAVTVHLPASSPSDLYIVKAISNVYATTIVPASGLIDGAATFILPPGGAPWVWLLWDGSNFQVIG